MLKLFKKKFVRLPVVLLLVLTMALTVTTGWLGSVSTGAEEVDQEFQKVLDQLPDEEYGKVYKEKLTELHKKHPNWTFEVVNTGLDWNKVIKGEMVLRTNLVPHGKNQYGVPYKMSRGWLDLKSGNSEWSWYETPTAWKAIFDVNGSFDWGANDWVPFDSGAWCQASKAAVSYVMDPRNWLDENYIYMFEKLNYNDKDTIEIVNNALAGTFMYNKTCPGSKKTYAQVICDAAKEYGVSAIFLAVRLRYEKGVNNDTLGGGVSTKDGTTFYANPGGNDGQRVYYNYFNINAGGTGQEIINNGGKEAMNAQNADGSKGWTTPYLAIMGGAKKVADRYIGKGQNTLYFQKFCVEDVVFDKDGNYFFYKQYQQNVLAPLTEGSTLSKSYKNAGVDKNESRKFTFRIPVYENMPASPCSVPMAPDGNYYNTSNPNCILKSLSFKNSSGNTIAISPSFNPFDTGIGENGPYYIRVPYSVTSVGVYAEAIAGTSKVYVNGYSDMHNIPLETGNNTIEIVCTSQYGTSWTYHAVIYRSKTATGFETNETQVNGPYISGFTVGDNVKTAIGRMKIDSSKGVIKILDSSKKEKAGDALICTGDYVQVRTPDGNVDMEYQVVIYGDVNGDGKADLLDYASIKMYHWDKENSKLSGINLEAADVYPASKGVDILDMAAFKIYMWDHGSISQRR